MSLAPRANFTDGRFFSFYNPIVPAEALQLSEDLMKRGKYL